MSLLVPAANTIAAMTWEWGRRTLVVLTMAILAASLLAACGSSSESGSDQFRDKTDSPLLDFGEEASASELEEGEEVVEAFLAARAKGDWQQTCAQLSRAMLAKIEHLATTSTGLEDTSCPAFLEAFVRLSKRERSDSAIVDAGSLRKQGRRAYLLYYGANEVVYAMPLSREGSAWKVDALAPELLG